MNVKKRKAVKAVTAKKKDTELHCPEVAKEITGWSAASAKLLASSRHLLAGSARGLG
jgi:hypothetical protein